MHIVTEIYSYNVFKQKIYSNRMSVKLLQKEYMCILLTIRLRSIKGHLAVLSMSDLIIYKLNLTGNGLVCLFFFITN